MAFLWWASLFFTLFWGISCGGDSLELSPHQIESGQPAARIVDVREAAERRQEGWISNSEWVPLDELAHHRRDLLPGEVVVLVCSSGVRSLRAARYLRDQGYTRAYSLKGGMDRWKLEQRPLISQKERWVGTSGATRVGFLLVEGSNGLEVGQVLGKSPAARAGLRRGDRLEEEGELEGVATRLEREGTHLLRVQREGRRHTLSVEVKPHPRPDPAPPGERGPEGVCYHENTSPEHRSRLRAAQLSSPVESRPGQRSDVGLIRQDPSQVGAILRPILHHLNQAQSPGRDLLDVLDLAGIGPISPQPSPRCMSESECSRVLISTLERAARLTLNMRQSWPPLTQLQGWMDSFLVGWSREKTVEDVADPQIREGALSLVEMAADWDPLPLGEATAVASSLLDPIFLDQLVTWAHKLPPTEQIPPHFPATGELRLAAWTPWGPVAIGGLGANRYVGNFGFVLDLGGDDFYGEGMGSTSGSVPVSVTIDLAGDDRWEAGHSSAQGAGILGISLVLDRGGNDTYLHRGRVDGKSPAPTQGAGYFGVGALWDEAGDDSYQAGAWSQGMGLWGVGMLVDLRGKDRYEAGHFAQGAGGPGGVGLLREGAGSDVYILTGRAILAPEDTHHQWSAGQGVGMGVRRLYGGGMGILMDVGGDDHYQGGYYVQGSGWYLGTGTLWDGGGRDTYQGQSFSQGAGVHQAVGALFDEEGDDTYYVDGHKSQGAGWDLGVGLLADGQGQDQLEARDLAQGFAAHHGVGILMVRSGAKLTLAGAVGGGEVGADTYGRGRKAASAAMICHPP